MGLGIGAGIGIGIGKIGAKLNQILLSVSAITDTSIKLDWNGNENKTYSIERSTDNVNYSTIETITGSTYTDSGLTEGTLYYYRIKLGSIYSNFDLAIAKQPYTLIQDFDNVSEFIKGQASTTIDVTTERFIDGSGALQVQSGASGDYVGFTLDPPIRANGNFHIRLFVPAGKSLGLSIARLSKTSNMQSGTWTGTSIVNGVGGSYDQATFQTGWRYININRSHFTYGTPTLLDDGVSEFGFIWVGFNANQGPGYIDSIRCGLKKLKATAVLTFDDGNNSVIEVNDAVWGVGKSAFDYMRDNNIKATSYIIGERIGTPSYLTVSEVDSLYNAGWDIGNHTYTHEQITLWDDAKIQSELAACDAILAANGWERGRKHLAYPGGSFTLDTHPALIKSLGFKTARTVQATILNQQHKQSDADRLYALTSRNVGLGITVQNVTDKIDEAIDTGAMFSMYVHGLGEPETADLWSPTKFKETLDYLIAKRDAGLIDILTISEWHKLVT